MDVLLIVPVLPYPLHDGDSLRHYNMIKRLSSHCDITLVAFAGERQLKDGLDEMKRLCNEVHAIPSPSYTQKEWLLRFARSLVQGAPLCAAVHYVPAMRNKVLDLLRERHFDIIQVEHTFLGQYLRDAKKLSSARTILTVHNIEAVRYRRLFRFEPFGQYKIRYAIESALLPRFEKWAIRIPDRCITVSQTNSREMIRDTGRLDIIVIENGVDVSVNTPVQLRPDARDLLFLGGMNYPPNVDAAVYMAESILPLVRREVPDVKLNIVGRSPDAKVRALADIDGITVQGDVPDVKPWYERSAISVVPLRSGGGTRLKILESMALGVPVVSTTVGCEGLEVTDGEDILIADDPEGFAKHVCNLLRDPELRTRVAGNARQLVERSYSWDAIAPKLLEVYQSLLKEGGRS